MELDKIYNIDCLEGIKQMPDGSVDAVVTSPPYNLCLRVRGDQYTRRSKGEKRAGLNANKYTNGLSDSLDMEDYFDWQCKCIDEMMRISKGVVFYNIQAVTGNKWAVFKIIGKYADNIREVLIWDKMNAEPAIGNRILNSEYEFIIVFDHGDCKGRQFNVFNAERGVLSNVLRIGKNHENDHRAAFPLQLPQHLVHYFTPMGGGSSRSLYGQWHNRHRVHQGKAALHWFRVKQGILRQGRATHQGRAGTAHVVLNTNTQKGLFPLCILTRNHVLMTESGICIFATRKKLRIQNNHRE